MKTRVTDLWLYRWRYLIGYAAIIIAIGTVLTIASLHVPGSLRQGEMDAALKSGSLSTTALKPDMIVNLPYHVLQRLSFTAFGVSTWSIKLPSIILGVATSIGIFLLIRTWFRRNIAVLTTLVATTTTQFLFLIQDGTPAIMFSFLTIWILFAATYVTRKKLFSTLWKVVTGVLIAAAMYTPLGIYLVLAVLTTIFFHPHIRHIVLRASRSRMIMAVVFGLLSLIPVVYASILDKNVVLSLIGLPIGEVHMLDNLREVGLKIFGFAGVGSGYMLRPLYSLGIILLSGVGLYKLLTYKYTARSYITLTLGLLMIPLVLLNPEHVTDLFPLAVLMIALGIATLVTDWYKLFPHNPYARVAGLLPLGVVVGGIVFSGVLRYMNNYEYNPSVLAYYSSDLRLIQDQLNYQKAGPSAVSLVVVPADLPFYSLVAQHDKRFAVTTTSDHSSTTLFVTHDAYHASKPSSTPSLIVTNRRANNADRLYVFDR